jgi:phosphoglucosamine mutase
LARKLFGTDGVRGVAGEVLTAPLALSLGRAATEGVVAQARAAGDGRSGPQVLLIRDTRESGEMLEAALAAGVAAAGGDVLLGGVLPTPAAPLLLHRYEFDLAAVISASHNPYRDNGIKVFARTGFKLPDNEEHEVEEEIFRILPEVETGASAAELPASFSAQPYLDFLLSTLSTRLDGLRIVLDCGNGAASALAPELFRAAGADVVAMCNEPNGRNINLDCGALHLERLREKVLEMKADAGVAFDGDADRALLIASSGKIVDGDAIMLIAARRLQQSGHLPGNIVVATVMSNLGLEKALGRLGIAMVRTPVGDKYVLDEMLLRNAPLGGEQSGHIIFREYATTGDGMLTALKVLETCVLEKASLDTLAADLQVFPQLLVNVRVKQRRPLDELPAVQDEIRACEAVLNGAGRVLVRFSGTEPLLRVMVEGAEQGQIEHLASRIVSAIQGELG